MGPFASFRPSAAHFRGRDASYLAPPAQIRTSPIRAYGLYGAFVVKEASRHFCRPLSFHSFVRPAPQAFFRPDRIFASPSRAAAVKDGACMGLVWGFVCQGGITPFLSSFVIPFFCSTCAATAAAEFYLMLSGRTQGGQLCLPGGIPIKLEAVLPRSMGAGLWRHAGMTGYTSVGAGTSLMPVRLNCPPEISLHTLRRAE